MSKFRNLLPITYVNELLTTMYESLSQVLKYVLETVGNVTNGVLERLEILISIVFGFIGGGTERVIATGLNTAALTTAIIQLGKRSFPMLSDSRQT